MKRYILSILILTVTFLKSEAQSLSPKVIATSGGYYTNGSNSLSWTIGETVTTTMQNGNVLLTQGQQQPYVLLKILNLKAIIEGFYLGNGQMNAVLYNNDPIMYSPDACDSITIELHEATTPYNIITSASGILLTDGNAELKFPSLANGSYYIVLRHRNAMQTWSKHPVVMNASMVEFDFTAQ